jgi:hypothetical protein
VLGPLAGVGLDAAMGLDAPAGLDAAAGLDAPEALVCEPPVVLAPSLPPLPPHAVNVNAIAKLDNIENRAGETRRSDMKMQAMVRMKTFSFMADSEFWRGLSSARFIAGNETPASRGDV